MFPIIPQNGRKSMGNKNEGTESATVKPKAELFPLYSVDIPSSRGIIQIVGKVTKRRLFFQKNPAVL
jgi:hypothetical protein